MSNLLSTANLVSTEWLAAHLKDVRVVDASWYMPGESRDPAAEFAAAHIPGAVHFGIDAIADRSTDLPHMLPTADAFAQAVGALGIGNDHTVVVYDGSGIFSAPRVWWMFKAMGHDKVKVLDGGLPKWKDEGRAVEIGPADPVPQTFRATPRPGIIRKFDDVMDIVRDRSAQIADARSPGRFTGDEAKPRPGVRGGHMPGAANVHFRTLLADGSFKPPAQLREIFAAAGVDVQKPIVTSCGTGVTAAILMLALDDLGAREVSLYDGSWTEWGGRPDAPVVKD
ncbi:MAG: thiosulfate sulfurtransferase [Pseudomonadota bacterium]|jgi:thiosulfate/3-mercaptopyruvate sulfurtransferase